MGFNYHFVQLNFTGCLSIRLALLCCPRPRSGSGLPLLPRLACPPAAAAACLPGLPRPVAFLPPSWPFWGLPFSDRLCTLARFSKASCWFWSCLRHAWIRNVLYHAFVFDRMDPLGSFLKIVLYPHTRLVCMSEQNKFRLHYICETSCGNET